MSDAKATYDDVVAEYEAMKAERDALKARLAEAERYISALEDHMDSYGLDAAQRSMGRTDSAPAMLDLTPVGPGRTVDDALTADEVKHGKNS